MSTQAMCLTCAESREVETLKRPEAYRVRREPITVEHTSSVCRSCGEEFASAEQAQDGLARAKEEYRERRNPVPPAEITAIRASCDAGRKAFATVLGLGEATVHSSEQGALSARRRVLTSGKPLRGHRRNHVGSMRVV